MWKGKPRRFFVIFLALFAFGSYAQSLTNYLIPTVTILATDPYASWSGHTGTFTVFREGSTNQALNVYYAIGGTASNGVDYASISHWVTIPAGARTNTITITPINTGQTKIETVELNLTYSPLMPPINYVIGYPATATVFISPAGITNIPPAVAITSPPDGSVFNTPGYLGLVAVGSDPDGVVTSVEFFTNGTSLGVVTNWVAVDPPGPGGVFIPGSRAFLLTRSNPPAGTYALTAKATDNGGASSVSSLVHIMVQTGPPPPPPTNYPPLVRISSPPNGAFFRAPVNIPIYAYAFERGGVVTNVGFFAGTMDLGSGHGLCAEVQPGSIWPPACPTNFFVRVWSNAPVGVYSLTAVATDDGGISATSSPVSISIVSAPPPPTNRPPIVSIDATDPLAIEGTNCWPWLGLGTVQPTWSNWLGGVIPWRFFTNCGPKNAAFTLRRFGDTNQDLTVLYAIGGTATNGVDYGALSGSVVIPASERLAQVTIVPLDDGPPDINSTVILRLLPSTNYNVGFPHSAAVLILDSGGLVPRSQVLPDNSFHLSATGPDGAWFHIEYSPDLTNWTSICTNQVVNGLIEFVDPDAANNPWRFYRAVPEANPPGN